MTVHLSPKGDGGMMPCCGKTPFEMPTTDRMTNAEHLVDCNMPGLHSMKFKFMCIQMYCKNNNISVEVEYLVRENSYYFKIAPVCVFCHCEMCIVPESAILSKATGSSNAL